MHSCQYCVSLVPLFSPGPSLGPLRPYPTQRAFQTRCQLTDLHLHSTSPAFPDLYITLRSCPNFKHVCVCVCTTPRDTRRRHLLIILRVWGRRGRKCWDICLSPRLRFWIGFLKHYSDLRKSGVRVDSKCVLSCSRAVVPPLDSLHWSHLMCPPSLQSLEGPIRLLEPRYQSPPRRLLCE